MNILLTDEEMTQVIAREVKQVSPFLLSERQQWQAISRAQAQRIIEGLEERWYSEMADGTPVYSCRLEDWQALKEEVKDD